MESTLIKKIKPISIGMILIACSCSNLEDALDDLVPLLDDAQPLKVVQSYPPAGSSNLPFVQQFIATFNREIDPAKCSAAFSISPSVEGDTIAFNNTLTFIPDSPWIDGSHVASISTSCEDTNSRDLLGGFDANFSIGSEFPAYIQAIGLESQSCATVYPGSGNVAGGNHTLGSCWWDNSLSVLSPTNYEFRGGDTGAGSVGAATDCIDVNTDNFRIIFSTYMDTGSTHEAITLTRISPPTTTIKIASYAWTDCQAIAPFGCRAVTIAFAEAEASCNGTVLFGDAATSGDFNLGSTTTPAQIANFPFYRLEVDSTARDAAGSTIGSTFSFIVEGN